MRDKKYNDSVFINCPFDPLYLPLLQAIVYTVYRCGFIPRCALDEDDATDFRLEKINRCIEGCKYGIHDISRTQLNANGFPRFNMPFELGIFFAAKTFGNKEQRSKMGVIFETEKFTYQQYISDLNGIDTKAHNNDPLVVIEKLRDWLRAASKRITIPGHLIIIDEFKGFLATLPLISEKMGLDKNDIPFSDFCVLVESYIGEKIARPS